MLSALVDQCRDWPVVEIVEAPADQGETLAREIFHRRREIELPLEPGFDPMRVRRRHVEPVGGQHLRADMAGDELLDQGLIGRTGGQHADQPPTRGHEQGQRSRDGEQTPGKSAWGGTRLEKNCASEFLRWAVDPASVGVDAAYSCSFTFVGFSG